MKTFAAAAAFLLVTASALAQSVSVRNLSDPGAFEVVNEGGTEVSLSSFMQVQRLVNRAWKNEFTDMRLVCASYPPPPTCITLRSGERLRPPPWNGTSCVAQSHSQCAPRCGGGNVPLPPGTFRFVVASCLGGESFAGPAFYLKAAPPDPFKVDAGSAHMQSVRVRNLTAPGNFEVVNESSEDVALSYNVEVQSLGNGGWQNTQTGMRLVCNGDQRQIPDCMTLHGGESMRPPPWSGSSCGAPLSDCPLSCRTVFPLPPGTFRFIVASCSGSESVVGPAFPWWYPPDYYYSPFKVVAGNARAQSVSVRNLTPTGGFEVVNEGGEVSLWSSAQVQGLVNGVWLDTGVTVQLVRASCPPPSRGDSFPITLHAGEHLRPPPWNGLFCDPQSQCAGMCRANYVLPPGMYRFVVALWSAGKDMSNKGIAGPAFKMEAPPGWSKVR